MEIEQKITIHQIKIGRMEFKLSSPAGGELEIIMNAQDNDLPYKLPASLTDIVKGKFGRMYFNHFKTDDFSSWSSVYDIKEETIIHGRVDNPVLEIHGSRENQFHTSWDGVMNSVQRQDQYNISFVPHTNNKAEFEPGLRCRTFDIHPTLKLLQGYAPYYPVLDKFVNKVEKGHDPCSLVPEGFFITRYMNDCLDRITDYYCNPGLTASFYEAKVKEFLIMLLDRVSYLHDRNNNVPKFTPYQVEATDAARDILIKDLSQYLWLVELDPSVALNECILKKCFKYRFGTSIHQYFISERMKKAKMLLLDPTLPIFEICLLLGYADKQNFYSDFKKHFQMTPGQWSEENNVIRKEIRELVKKGKLKK